VPEHDRCHFRPPKATAQEDCQDCAVAQSLLHGGIRRVRALRGARWHPDGLRISAQIGLCDAKFRAVMQIIFRPIRRPARARASVVALSCACWRPMRCSRRARKKRRKKSTFMKREPRAPTIQRMRAVAKSRLHGRPVWPTASGGAENNCRKVLTLEKTVIRFRPADVTCGRE